MTQTLPRQWTEDLPRAFVALCDRYEMSGRRQAYVLALALESGDVAVPQDPQTKEPLLSAAEIEDLVHRLTPVREPGDAESEAAFPFPAMPVGGALDPVQDAPKPAQTVQDDPAAPKPAPQDQSDPKEAPDASG